MSNFSCLVHSCFKDQKKRSIAALSQQLPVRHIEQVMPSVRSVC